MIPKYPRFQSFTAFAGGFLLLGLLSGHVLADSDEGAGPEFRESLLRPVKLVSTSGNVQNAEALVEGHGHATLTMVAGGAAPLVILDYGRDVGGLPVFEVAAVSGTPKLQASYSEAQQFLLPSGDAAAPGVPQDPTVAQPEVSFVGNPAGADLSRADIYPLSRPGLLISRLIQGGERFEAITLASPRSVTLRQIGIQAKFFIPHPTDNRGSFRCSDSALNEITDSSNKVLYESPLTDPSILDQFAAGTNVLPSIMDGGKRDRSDFTGDIGISGLTLLYSTFAREYLAGSIELFSSFQSLDGGIPISLPPQYRPGVTPFDRISPTFLALPDYPLQHVTSIYHYYLYTGDRAFLLAQWPVVQKVIGLYESLTNNPQHLVLPPSFFGPPAADTLTNAHFYGVLLQAAQLASALDLPDVAADYTATAAQLRPAINANLFNASTGLYDVSTAQRGVAPQDGNSYAILYWVAPAPGTTVQSILQKLTAALYRTPTAPNAVGPVPVQQSSGSTQVGPYTSAYELFERFETGDTAGALELIRDEWGLMRRTSAYYSGATWEYVALDGTPGLGEGTSLAHGWASGPTSALSKYVLGVRPVTAGYKTWLVEPQTGDLSFAEGTVPTPHGPIKVRWEKEGNRFELLVEVPDGTLGTIGVPVSETGGTLIVSGQSVKSQAAFSEKGEGRPGYAYVRDLTPGTYRIVVPAASK